MIPAHDLLGSHTKPCMTTVVAHPRRTRVVLLSEEPLGHLEFSDRFTRSWHLTHSHDATSKFHAAKLLEDVTVIDHDAHDGIPREVIPAQTVDDRREPDGCPVPDVVERCHVGCAVVSD